MILLRKQLNVKDCCYMTIVNYIEDTIQEEVEDS